MVAKVGLMANRPRRMHTVSAGYLRAFVDASAPRRNAHLWRHERETATSKLISVLDASVRRDIYAVRLQDGQTDTTIESALLSSGVEQPFCEAVKLLEASTPLSYWPWRHVSRFVAFQLARTPRAFQLLRDEWSREGLEIQSNDPPIAMVFIAPYIEKWLCAMKWIVCRNASTLPVLTSDNPAVMWANRGDGAELGVGFRDPALQVLFPLTPRICLLAVHTQASLRVVLEDTPDKSPQMSDFYPLQINRGNLGIDQIVTLNQITVSNAEHHVYSNSNAENVKVFLDDLFFGQPAPVRRSDRMPIGSPMRAAK
jgi:hypothetical protein